MSKVTAYICDYGNHLMQENAIMGVNPIEDMFNRLESYPSIVATRTDVHVCTECYKKVVLTPAQNMVDRRNNEEAYKAKVKELGYGFRAQAVKNHRDKNRNSSVTKKYQKKKG